MLTRTMLGWSLVLAMAVVPSAARAQCSNLTGNPAPQPEQYAANKAKLKYLSTGPGFGDDKPELYKSTFTSPSFAFDPLTQHTVHFTFTKNTIAGPVMWTANVPPSSTLWTMQVLGNGNIRWRYNDPTATYGVKKAQIIKYASLPGLYVWTYVKAVNQNIANAPLAPADQLHVMVELESGGVGVCYDGTSTRCTGTGNTQTCKV